jgi:hypothetical protein
VSKGQIKGDWRAVVHRRFSQKMDKLYLTLLICEKRNGSLNFWENLPRDNLLTVLSDLKFAIGRQTPGPLLIRESFTASFWMFGLQVESTLF